MAKKSLRERLLSKAVINWETGCWEWTAHRSSAGYGRIQIGKRNVEAYRVAYELIEGSVPQGLHLDHLCRVRHCINPAHLEPVTQRENTLRGVSPAARHAARNTCAAGHLHSESNTRVINGKRSCRECDRARQSRYRNKRANLATTNAGEL